MNTGSPEDLQYQTQGHEFLILFSLLFYFIIENIIYLSQFVHNYNAIHF